MSYPTNQTNKTYGRFPTYIDQKLLEFKPYAICSAYQGFEVVQIQGIESKEFFFGNYFNGKFTGYIYCGEMFTQKEAFLVCQEYLPDHLEDLDEYDEIYRDKIWYLKLPSSQYAWICEKVLLKTN